MCARWCVALFARVRTCKCACMHKKRCQGIKRRLLHQRARAYRTRVPKIVNSPKKQHQPHFGKFPTPQEPCDRSACRSHGPAAPPPGPAGGGPPPRGCGTRPSARAPARMLPASDPAANRPRHGIRRLGAGQAGATPRKATRQSGRTPRACRARRLPGERWNESTQRGPRRVRLVRKEGRDVSRTVREGGGKAHLRVEPSLVCAELEQRLQGRISPGSGCAREHERGAGLRHTARTRACALGCCRHTLSAASCPPVPPAICRSARFSWSHF